MRTFLTVLVSLSLAACAPAQTAIQQVASAPGPSAPTPAPELLQPGYDPVASCQTVKLWPDGAIEYTLVGVFPKTDTAGTTYDHYRLTCPTYTITHVRYGPTTIVGLTLDQLEPLLRNDGIGQRAPYMFRVRFDSRIDLSTPGLVTISTREAALDVGANDLVAARQGTGPVIPVLYKGTVTPFSYDPARPLELYRPTDGTGSQWSRLTWEASSKTLTLEPDVPLP